MTGEDKMNAGARAGADGDELYSRLHFRREVAWPKRIEREWPFLSAQLSEIPEPSVVDLGCGTGQHSMHLAQNGFRAIGIDRSESLIDSARERAAGIPGVRFLLGDMLEADELVGNPVGGALCLGNTFAFLTEEEEVRRFAGAVRRALLAGGRWIVQTLNYARLSKLGQRHLPLDFHETDEGELVYLRMLDISPEGRVTFVPTTLLVRPQADPPVEAVSSRVVPMRAWTPAQLLPLFEEAGFSGSRLYGSLKGDPFDVEISHDLVVTSKA